MRGSNPSQTSGQPGPLTSARHFLAEIARSPRGAERGQLHRGGEWLLFSDTYSCEFHPFYLWPREFLSPVTPESSQVAAKV